MLKLKKESGKIILNLIILIILAVSIFFLAKYYEENNFYSFSKSEENLYSSEFKRDNKEKYSNNASYKIVSNNYNDAAFHKVIDVKKNMPYKVTCMVKVKDVKEESSNSGIGAQISIIDSTERSIAVKGTADWQKIEFIFNSKDREQVDIGFRLGGNDGRCTGTAWFSNLEIEEGTLENSNEWKFACFIFENTQVNINNQELNFKVTASDISDINTTIKRFETACATLSNQKMTAKCDTFRIQEPIKTLSYDDEFGYYVAPEDVEKQIRKTINNSEYDHIFVVVRLGDNEHQKSIEINDWIGLGYMDYYGIGYSNIRLPNDSKSYIYKYNTNINTFPEEVLLHEFLHSLERTSNEYGYEIPKLHDYEKYGYTNERLNGQKKWYTDYMNCNIELSTGKKIGLPSDVYKLKPAKSSNFSYAYKLDCYKEPSNILEEISEIFNRIIKKI